MRAERRRQVAVGPWVLGLLWALVIGHWSSLPAAQTNLNDRSFTLPDGFALELVAAAPLVHRPISIAYDDQGRLYATDSSGSNEKGPKKA